MAQRSRSSSDSTVLLLHRKEAPAQRNALRNSEVPSICRNNRWMTRKLPASKSGPGLFFQKLREQIFIDLHIVAFDLIYRLLIAIARKTRTKKRQACPGAEHTMSFYHILEYIDSHSSEPLEVQELARLCHMSYSSTKAGVASHRSRSGNSLSPDSFAKQPKETSMQPDKYIP